MNPSHMVPINGTRTQEAPILLSYDDIRNAAKSGNLYCPFSDECNPAVALISVVTDQGVERCTGFLTSNNEVVTNDHCIDHSTLLQKGWDKLDVLPCNTFVYIHFASLGIENAPIHFNCKAIERRSGENGIASPDYAIIKLDGSVTDRAPVIVSERGFLNHEKAKIFRVQMTNDGTQTGFNGMQTKLDCQATYGTYLYPAINSSQSSLMTFGDCAIQSGNSGSPAFNEKGEVGAVIQGYLVAKNDPLVKTSLSLEERTRVSDELTSLALDGSYGEVAIGTTLSCVNELNSKNPKNCEMPSSVGPTFPSDFLKTFSSFDQSVLSKPESNYEWRSVQSASQSERTFILAPHCGSASSFEAVVMTYKKGLNRFMEGGYKAVTSMNEKKVTLTSSGVATQISGLGSAFTYLNSEIGSVLLPACDHAFK